MAASPLSGLMVLRILLMYSHRPMAPRMDKVRRLNRLSGTRSMRRGMRLRGRPGLRPVPGLLSGCARSFCARSFCGKTTGIFARLRFSFCANSGTTMYSSVHVLPPGLADALEPQDGQETTISRRGLPLTGALLITRGAALQSAQTDAVQTALSGRVAFRYWCAASLAVCMVSTWLTGATLRCAAHGWHLGQASSTSPACPSPPFQRRGSRCSGQ